MTASADTKPTPVVGGFQLRDTSDPTADSAAGQQRMFKKHKVLPRPRKEGFVGEANGAINGGMTDLQRAVSRRHDPETDTSLLLKAFGSQTSSPSASLRQQTKRVGEPPPTPPAHSRTSSSSHSGQPSSPTYVATPVQSSEDVQARRPATPTNQRSPPTPKLTPERTPPRAADPPAKALRPMTGDRIPSRVTTDSRSESFKTAPENPCSSEEDDDGRSTLRPVPSSQKTSQSSVRQVNGMGRQKPQVVGLGLDLRSSPDGNWTPQSKAELDAFDGEWSSNSDEVEQEWDDNLMRKVIVKKRRPPAQQTNGHKVEVIEHTTVAPTNATKALRSIPLDPTPGAPASRRVISDPIRHKRAPSAAESLNSTDNRRASVLSTKSAASTVVEAILVETTPQRKKTLRHVKKQPLLRDSASDLSPSSSVPNSVTLENDAPRSYQPTKKAGDAPRESRASNSTFNSVSSRKARRDVWKSGGIPVIVIPERQSSARSSSKEPSLRSVSRSRRSQSLGSAPPPSRGKESGPHFERPTRRSRTLSESDGSRPGDQRTMDFPPVIPARSSSLSAPTSRNVSRTTSLTADSLRAQHAFQMQQAHQALQNVHEALQNVHEALQKAHANGPGGGTQHGQHARDLSIALKDLQTIHLSHDRAVQRAPSMESSRSGRDIHEAHGHQLGIDRDGDPLFGKRLSVQNTPFSQTSVETNATSHAEVSEATAVSIYPHQNTSVMMVHHSSRPSESSSLENKQQAVEPEIVIQAPPAPAPAPAPASAPAPAPAPVPAADNGAPLTPPQPILSMDDVDSPLRNPRAPPEPPAINFIPATPSGLTPTAEKNKQLGNFYETVAEKPARSMSLLRKTLGRGRMPSDYGPSASRTPGLLTRTLSLTRSIKKETSDNVVAIRGQGHALTKYPTADSGPTDETRLHPFWRPTYFDRPEDDDDDDENSDTTQGRTYRYPLVDNRPAPPRRSLSGRLKRTFAILPLQNEYDDYYPKYTRGPVEHRTIRRTPSGNLRVMKRPGSSETLSRTRQVGPHDRPYTASDEQSIRGRRQGSFWRSPSTQRMRRDASVSSRRSAVLAGLSQRMNIVRRMNERRREKRSKELRQMISGPREVRDGVGDVIRRNSYREAFAHSNYHQI